MSKTLLIETKSSAPGMIVEDRHEELREWKGGTALTDDASQYCCQTGVESLTEIRSQKATQAQSQQLWFERKLQIATIDR